MIIDATLIILMSITFILVFLFIRTIDKRMWLTLLVSIALTPFIYFFAVFPMINIFSSYHHQKYFSSDLWKNKPDLRYELSDNMFDSKLLVGKTQTEIEALLGTHEWLSWNDSLKDHDQNKWNYSLGQKPGAFNDKKECVELVFKNDKVITLRPYQETITYDTTDD